MAEQKITVKLDPMQVNDLKQFVRDEIEKERRANVRVVATGGDAVLRQKILTLLDGLVDKYDERDDIRAGVVSMWLKGLLK
jgi:transcriptional/translational regulatory protein YebC/TACO1